MENTNTNADQAELNAILASFTDAPDLSAAQLEGSFWRIFDINGRQLSPFMVLAPHGLLGNPGVTEIDLWQIVNGRLCLMAADGSGIPAVVFTLVRRDDTGRIISFAGQGTIGGVRAFYFLRATGHPPHPLHATPAEQPRRAAFIKQPAPGTRRPNLVIVPAGAGSLHPDWLKSVTNETRNWDLCLGWYGAEAPTTDMPCEYLAHLPKTRKFRLLYDLLHEGSPLWDYEAIWLPDDDLLASGQGINLMFYLFRKFGMDLAQPSVLRVKGSYPNHAITIQRPDSDVRYEPFVEIMCPVFSRRALKICVGSMRDTESGYGLDHLWPALLGQPRTRMGIIDRVPVAHTRPVGASYDVQRAIDEQAAVLRAYNHTMRKMAGVY
ncbi:MAG: DUF707 domain-containing protein [Bordetella sp.]|uniref:DUF707 domain-containing protein n=1 Tax=Bordetella sp. TaxID=28081 RepID=UPI003F7C478B